MWWSDFGSTNLIRVRWCKAKILQKSKKTVTVRVPSILMETRKFLFNIHTTADSAHIGKIWHVQVVGLSQCVSRSIKHFHTEWLCMGTSNGTPWNLASLGYCSTIGQYVHIKNCLHRCSKISIVDATITKLSVQNQIRVRIQEGPGLLAWGRIADQKQSNLSGCPAFEDPRKLSRIRPGKSYLRY